MVDTASFLAQLQRIQVGGVASLASAARQTGRSRFQFHRLFRRLTGETFKQYGLRVRLERSAAALVTSRQSVLSVALAHGFASHEVFTRAFRRRFALSPLEYRRRGVSFASRAQRQRHVRLTDAIAPCTGLFHMSAAPAVAARRAPMPILSIVRKDVAPLNILFIRRHVRRPELQQALGECFGVLFGHGARKGLPVAGWPLCRYLAASPAGTLTVEPAMPLAAPATGEGEIQAGQLPGGPVAFAVHAGPYQDLPHSYGAIERWVEANGHQVAGAPWEQYVTDPAEHPDPADWRTEIYWPLK